MPYYKQNHSVETPSNINILYAKNYKIEKDFNILYNHMKKRYFDRLDYTDVNATTYLIVAAEGMKDKSGDVITDESEGTDSFGHKKLAGAGKYVKNQLDKRLSEDEEIEELMKKSGMYVKDIYTKPEIRTLKPGHLVRSGESSAFDVNFGLEAGSAAVQLLLKDITGVTVARVNGRKVKYMKTADAIVERKVDLDQVAFHENMGVCFGRETPKLELDFDKLTSAPERHL